MTPPVLQLTGVRKSFAGVHALKGVTMEVAGGEVHALLGENGAGKSTLMAIAAGALAPDEGEVRICGEPLAAHPDRARALGLAVVYQHPAILDDLTVAENMVLAVQRRQRPPLGSARTWAAERLARLGADIDPDRRGGDLTPAERQVVEIAKALALEPKVLVLDEPTAALNAAEVEQLFSQVEEIRRRGTAVVYISHRIPEVTRIADRITVLRNGEHRGTIPAADATEETILQLIVGRELSTVFPAKGAGADGGVAVETRSLAGIGFDDVSLEIRRGEIVGFAGAEGNGQREALRAIAGLEPCHGQIVVDGEPVRLSDVQHAQAAGCYYVPADRPVEGVFRDLSVRENIVASSLDAAADGGVMRRGRERALVGEQMGALAVKAASPEVDVATLSGGNQQKVVFARSLMTGPRVLLCDEPTQGVDPGARVEIYRLLRRQADDGHAVAVLSSDAVELQGLCDRVLVFSRGHVIATLEGEDVTEERITRTAVASTTSRGDARVVRQARRLFARGDQAPAAILVGLIVALAVGATMSDSTFLSTININSLLFLAAALILASIGQLTALLIGGIDLSIGAVMTLTVVLLSFFLSKAGAGQFVLGIVVMLAAAIGVGLLNALLIRKARISPIITTVATLTALGGVALLLRKQPGGIFPTSFVDGLQKSVGPLPIAFVVVMLVAVVAEIVLRRTSFGLSLRAVGSDEVSAYRLGVKVDRVAGMAYIIAALFAALAGMLLAAQVGLGDPTVGGTYTLASVTAVVLGGASIYGGRGSYLGAALGGLLTTEIVNSITFLHLGQAWQYWMPGALLLIAAGLFARARGVRMPAAPAEAAA
jgi:ribose transport system ATP-binding protein